MQAAKGRGSAAAIAIPWRQSGERQEPFGPPCVGQRRGKRGQRQRLRVIWDCARHRLVCGKSLGEGGLAKILVVEDNALNIKLFCDLLTAHGHQPEAVLDSREALDAARDLQARPGDHRHPAAACHGARADGADPQGRAELRDVPIMAVTAYSGVGDDERIRAAGAQAYVSKPISVVRFAEARSRQLLAGKTQAGAAGGNPAPRAT